MRRMLNLRRAALAAAACAVAAVAATPATAHAQDPIPIRPGQYFNGYVNGHPPGQAIIWTACFGPTTPGETGHPLANQTIEVDPANIARLNGRPRLYRHRWRQHRRDARAFIDLRQRPRDVHLIFRGATHSYDDHRALRGFRRRFLHTGPGQP